MRASASGGHRYPNLVDNMAIASKRKRSTREDPQGGLTQAGREHFARAVSKSR